MKRGIYLGHNVGPPCNLRIEGFNIYIFTRHQTACSRVFWNFILKFIFTKASIDSNTLHMKGVLVKSPSKKICVLLGKGGSGKTTLAKLLQKQGFVFLSNTHCFYKDNHIWGVNTWIRERQANGRETYQLECTLDQREYLDGRVNAFFIVEYNTKHEYKAMTMPTDMAYYYIKNYSAAITNYDLKEEVWDYFTDNGYHALDAFKREDEMIEKMLMKHDIRYISTDMRHPDHIYQVAKMMDICVSTEIVKHEISTHG